MKNKFEHERNYKGKISIICLTKRFTQL